MKKFILLIALVFTAPLVAQENHNTITVIGETDTKVDDQNYTILIAIQQIMVYEGQSEVEATSIEVVKENYINKLADLGIDFSRFRRNTYYEFSMAYGQNRKSEYYHLKTSNKDDVKKIIQIKQAGTTVVNVDIEANKLSTKQLAELSKQAIDDARDKADALASKLEKTTGEIVTIADQNTTLQYIQNYGTSSVQSHSVTVTFELK